MAEYVTRVLPGPVTVRVRRPGGTTRVRTRLATAVTAGDGTSAFQYVGLVTPGTLQQDADFVTGGTFSVELPFVLPDDHELMLVGTSNDADGAYTSTGTVAGVTTLVLSDVQPLAMQYRGSIVAVITDTTSPSREESVYVVTTTDGTDNVLLAVAGSIVGRTFLVGLRVTGALTAEQLIGFSGWGSIVTGHYIDNDDSLIYVDADAETITPLNTRQFDLLLVFNEFDSDTFTLTPVNHWKYVAADLSVADVPLPVENWTEAEIEAVVDDYLTANPPTATVDLESVDVGNFDVDAAEMLPVGHDADDCWVTDNLGPVTTSLRIMALVRPLSEPPGRFAEILTQTHDSEAGAWDNFELAVMWGDGNSGSIDGKPYLFYENTVTGGTEEHALRPFVDVGLVPGVATWVMVVQNLSANTLTFYRQVGWGGDFTYDGKEWEQVAVYTNSGFASIDTGCTERWFIGRNWLSGGIRAVKAWDGATLLLDVAADDADTVFTDGAGVEWTTVNGTVRQATAARLDALTAADVGAVPTTRTIDAGSGLSISPGGDLSADQTMSVAFGTTADTAAEGDDVRFPPTPVGATNGHVVTVQDDDYVLAAPPGGTVDVVSNVAADRILGRVTSGSGDSEELTAAQVRDLLDQPMVLIGTTVLNADTTTVEFTGLSGYRALVLVGSARSTRASATAALQFTFDNVNSGTPYRTNNTAGTPGSLGTIPAASATSTYWAQVDAKFNNTAGRPKNGQHQTRQHFEVSATSIIGLGYTDGSTEAAISSLQLFSSNSANLASGSWFTLMGVPA